MKKFKALNKKDWQIYKKTILTPLWIFAIFYLINIIILLVSYFTGNWSGLIQGEIAAAPAEALSFMGNALFVVFPGLIYLLFVVIVMQNALNEDKKIKCELFHRSQPVTLWQRTASKFGVGILGNSIIFLLMSIVNALVLNAVLLYIGSFDLSAALNGMFLAQLFYFKSAIVIGSFAFFMSAIFENSAFFKFVAILVGVNIIVTILNGVYGWSIPTPLRYFMALVHTNPVLNESTSQTFDLTTMIRANWSNLIFRLQTVYQLLTAAALYLGGTYIYGKKEIS
ncbi:MAG: hypothetical protein R6U84_07415 [Candidatus Cloacimonadales bacterium]